MVSTRSPDCTLCLVEKLISGRLERLQGTRISMQTDQTLFLLSCRPANLGLGLGCVTESDFSDVVHLHDGRARHLTPQPCLLPCFCKQQVPHGAWDLGLECV